MDMHDRRPGVRRLNGGGGNLLRVMGQCGLLVTRVSSPVMAQVMMTLGIHRRPAHGTYMVIL